MMKLRKSEKPKLGEKQNQYLVKGKHKWITKPKQGEKGEKK